MNYRFIDKKDEDYTVLLQGWGVDFPMEAPPMERKVRNVGIHTFETHEPSWDESGKEPWCLRQASNWRVAEIEKEGELATS